MRERVNQQVVVILLAASAAAGIVYVAVSQFDLFDSATGGRTGDSSLYARMATDGDIDGIPKPYRYRILVPFAAHLLLRIGSGPLNGLGPDARVQVVFGLLNLIGLTVAAWALYRYLLALRFTPTMSLVGVFLFLTSWTILRFGGAVLVDSWSFAALAAAAWAIASRRNVLLLVAVTVGVFVRETTLLALVLVFLLEAPRSIKVRQLACFAPGVVGYAVFRLVVAPTDRGYSYTLGRIIEGITDLGTASGAGRVLIDLALSFGAMWLLLALGVARNQRERLLPPRLVWLVPIALVIPFLIGSNFARIWFLAFPAVVPLALVGLGSVVPSQAASPAPERAREDALP